LPSGPGAIQAAALVKAAAPRTVTPGSGRPASGTVTCGLPEDWRIGLSVGGSVTRKHGELRIPCCQMQVSSGRVKRSGYNGCLRCGSACCLDLGPVATGELARLTPGCAPPSMASPRPARRSAGRFPNIQVTGLWIGAVDARARWSAGSCARQRQVRDSVRPLCRRGIGSPPGRRFRCHSGDDSICF
jgi:hypothetical protein